MRCRIRKTHWSATIPKSNFPEFHKIVFCKFFLYPRIAGDTYYNHQKRHKRETDEKGWTKFELHFLNKKKEERRFLINIASQNETLKEIL